MNKFKYRVFVFVITVCLMGIGIVLGYKIEINKIRENKSSENIEEVKSVDVVKNIENSDTSSSKKYNIEVVYVDHFTICDEEVEVSDETYQNTTLDEVIKKETEKQKEKNIKYDIIASGDESLTYYRNVDKYCDNHYKVIIEDNKINVYKLVTDKESKLYKTLDVSVNLIREDIKEQLNSGIIVNKSEDLGLLLDDLES